MESNYYNERVNPHLGYVMHPDTEASPTEVISCLGMRERLLAIFRWFALLVLWVFVITLWLPRIFPKTGPSAIATALGVCTQILAGGFVLYSLYHLTALAFALVRRQPTSATPSQREFDIPVGVVMTVCDDFQESAAETLLKLDYNHFHIYVCDDSADSDVKERVNLFHRSNPTKTTVIRRKGNAGFKAGNINHALRTGLITEPLILLVDADEKLKPHFLRCLVLEFARSDASFVQASHRAAAPGTTKFQRVLSPSVSVYWKVYEQARNTDGFPLVLGHGVLLPRLMIKELGGFDETTTSEDIEFSHRIAMSKKFGRGRVSYRIWGLEEVPTSVHRYRLRFCRWLKQDLALGLRVLLRIFSRSSSLSTAERFDLLIKQFHIPMCGLGLPYLFLLILLLFLSPATTSQPKAEFGHAEKSVLIAMGFALCLAPILPVLLLSDVTFLRRICCAATSVWLFNSLITASGLALAELFTQSFNVKFVPTGRRRGKEAKKRSIRQIALYLILLSLAGLSLCALLGSMALAALATLISSPKYRHLVNCAATALLVIGLLQVSANPVHILILLPLGTFRY